MRASDAEREQVAAILRAAMTEGRLDLATGEERLASVYAATYRDELGPLTADLPDGGREALARTPEAIADMKRWARRRAAAGAVGFAVLVGLGVLLVASGVHFFPVLPIIFLLFFVHGGRRWRGGYGHRGYYGGRPYSRRGGW